MPCVVVAGRRGLKGREWMPEGKRYTATAQDGVEAIGQCTKNSHQEGGKEHGRKDNCRVHGFICRKLTTKGVWGRCGSSSEKMMKYQ